MLWAGRSQHQAVGTSLAAIIPIGIVAAARYYFGAVTPQTDLAVALYLAVGGTVGTVLGSLAANRISDNGLKVIIAILLAVVGVKELYDVVVGTAPQLSEASVRHVQMVDYLLITVAGVGVGVVSGLTGVGGGILVVPLLVLGFGIGQRVAQGTSLVALLPTAAIGALTHYRSGNVDVRAAIWMGAAGVPAALAGASLALLLPQRALGGIFGVFLVVAALRSWPRRRPTPGS